METIEERVARVDALEGSRRVRRGEVEERALTTVDMPWLAQPTAAGIAVTPEAALRLVDVLACVRLLAESASILPLKAYRRTEDGREPAEGRLPDLLERPSPGNVQANLVSQIVASMAMRGNAYVGKFRNGEGAVEQLALIPADRVAVELVGGAPIYTVSGAHGVTTHGADQILHLKGVSTDGIVGLSPLSLAREALGLVAAVEETSSSLFRNQANPKGVLTVAGGANEDESMELLRAGFTARHGGSRGAGRVAVLTGDVKFTAVSLSPAAAPAPGSPRA